MRNLFERNITYNNNLKENNMETPKFKFELSEFHYYRSGCKILYGHIVNRRIKCDESNSKKECEEVYNFDVDDEDENVNYYDKQNIPAEDIFDSMEDCFKDVIKTVNSLCNWQDEINERMPTVD